MTRGRIVAVICLIGLGCGAILVALGAWRFAKMRQHARELQDEQRRALDAQHEMGGAGAGYTTVHAPWGVFNQIKYNFRERGITDEKLRHLAGLTGVVGLDLSGNPITDDGLRFVGQVPHLQWLQLSQTEITDRGISYLKGLKSLHTLDVSFTSVTQGAAKDLAEMPSLEIVYARAAALREVEGVEINASDQPKTWILDAIERPLKQEDGAALPAISELSAPPADCE